MPQRRWTNNHGADGLRDKFSVYKTKARASVPVPMLHCYADTDQIGADGEFVFVLRPETDMEAYIALRIYADVVAERAPQLACDLDERLDAIVAVQSS